MEKLDYIYVRAWHQMTGSYQCYIDMEASKARLEAFAGRLRKHEGQIDAMNGKRGTAWIGCPPLSIILMQRLNATRI